MTLPEVQRLFAYLKDNPSLRSLVMAIAGALGWKPPGKAPAPEQALTAEQAMALFQRTGGRSF